MTSIAVRFFLDRVSILILFIIYSYIQKRLLRLRVYPLHNNNGVFNPTRLHKILILPVGEDFNLILLILIPHAHLGVIEPICDIGFHIIPEILSNLIPEFHICLDENHDGDCPKEKNEKSCKDGIHNCCIFVCFFF